MWKHIALWKLLLWCYWARI